MRVLCGKDEKDIHGHTAYYDELETTQQVEALTTF